MLWGAALAVSIGALPAFQAPGLLWFCLLVFLFLWFLALIALADERWRRRSRQSLADPDFKQVYRWVTARLFARLWHSLCAPAPANSTAPATLRAALDAKVFDRALLIAVLYPILLPTLIWLATGTAGQLGSAIFLPATGVWDVWPERVTILAVCGILLFSLAAESWASTSQSRFWRGVSDWLPSVAVVVSVVVAIFFSVGFGVAVAGAFGAVFALSVKFAGGGAVAVASAGAFSAATLAAIPGAVVSGGLANLLWIAGRRPAAVGFVYVAMATALMGVAYFSAWTEVSEERKQLLLFLALLPIVNALFDALSYALTLSLMRLGLRRWNPVFAALADILCAVVLFLAVGAALTASVAGMNTLAGTPILDLGGLFAKVHQDPALHLWVFLMLFSTALPTLAHFTLALLGAQALVPRPLRKLAVRLIDTAPHDPFAAVFAPLMAGLVLAIPFALLGGLLWAMWHWGGDVIGAALSLYGDALLALAQWIGAF